MNVRMTMVAVVVALAGLFAFSSEAQARGGRRGGCCSSSCCAPVSTCAPVICAPVICAPVTVCEPCVSSCNSCDTGCGKKKCGRTRRCGRRGC